MTTKQSCDEISVDRLAGILRRVRVSAHVFHSGALPKTVRYDGTDGRGFLHVVREGCLGLRLDDGTFHQISAPAMVLLARPLAHAVAADTGALIIASAGIDLGGEANPLAQALPAVLVLPLDRPDDGAALAALADLLFAEAGQRHCGHQVIIDRLAEAILVGVLRRAMDFVEPGHSPGPHPRLGLLAGLSHPRLAVALTAMHDAPERDWSLESLADAASLSRSVFADTFHQVVGMPPGQYLSGWRMVLAKQALQQGHPLKQVAGQVGYASAAALSRAISRHFGANARALIKALR